MSTTLPQPVKCLVVDDLEENLLAMSALLHREEIEVLTARSGAQALEILLTHEVAIAFLDVHMPEMDGFELAELMRGSERTRHVPIMFVTAGMHDRYRQFKGYEFGAVDFLYKPIDPHILQSKAEVFFQLFRQKQLLAEQLRERTAALGLNEMFTAVLGHDLRNPLNAILMSAHLLERQGRDATVPGHLVRDSAARIVSSGKRMSRLISDLLDLARARSAGGFAINREMIDLASLVERVVLEFRASSPQRRIELRCEGDLRGEFDADRLAQVAQNLLGNAIQHGNPAEKVNITVDGRRGSEVLLTVSNDGSISAETMRTLFDPFRRGPQRIGSEEGLGLGLYIVQQIVRAHDGQVEVGNDGEGHIVFTVSVPRYPNAAPIC